MSPQLRFFTHSSPESAFSTIFLLRLAVGGIFVLAGLQKFLFPENMGAGRFAEMGLAMPHVLGPLVGGFELVCGILILIGFFTRLAAIPTAVIMFFALYLTKLPVFMADGFIAGAQAARLDFILLMGSVFLIISGAGKTAIDRRFDRRRIAR